MLEIAESQSSPVGSWIFFAFALFFISLAVLAILRYYLPLRTTPAFYLVPIFFALWLPSIVVILVPIDLASSATTDDEATRGLWLPQRVILVWWRIAYWLTFVLTWVFLPVLAEYADAGYREPKDKLMYSLRENAQFWAMVLGAGLVGLIYIFISYGPSIDSLKGTVMALAYFFGLILAIYLMGHGLVSIPRRLMRNASVSGRLRRLQGKAPKAFEKMEDSLVSLEEIEAQVLELSRRKTGTALDFQDWIEELQDMANIPESQPRSFAPADLRSESRIIPSVITEKYLADLTRQYMRARHTRSRYVDEWSHLVQEASETQMILDSAASRKLNFGAPDPHAGFWDKMTILTPYTRYLLHYQTLPYGNLALGGFLAAASACIVWSEVIKVAAPNLSIIRLSVVHHWVGEKAEVGFAGQVISAFWICYMCAAAFISMTEVKVWRGRALVKRNTAHESAFWYALQVAKLSIPISYNFLTLLSPRVSQKTIFYKFLGESIDLTPLRYFDNLYPVLVLLPVLATLFGLYGKVKRIFVGMDMIEEDEDENPTAYGTGSWREGRDLIDRELRGNSLRRHDDALSRLGNVSGTLGRRAGPVLSIPAARGSASSPARSPVRSSANVGRAGPSSRTAALEEPEDDNIFQIIGHRMKNTIDTIDTPQWLQEFGQGIKKPKWMGGDEGQRPSGERSNSDIRRWFGGDGPIRL